MAVRFYFGKDNIKIFIMCIYKLFFFKKLILHSIYVKP